MKITDFGIAKMAQQEIDEAAKGGEASLTASKTALGAIPYMAPEAIRATGQAGMASDVWAIGAMAYEQLCGARPFGAGYMAIPEILKAEPPEIPAIVRQREFWALGEPIVEIILSCLTKEPEGRPTADELVAKCEELCYSMAEREFGKVKTYVKSS